MELVVFRCDASTQIGSGHVMRCRTLARALKSRGAETVFLCRRQPGDLVESLIKEFRVLELRHNSEVYYKPYELAEKPKGRLLYVNWLGCTEEKDFMDSLEALISANLLKVSWLVVDHYGLGATWHKGMREGLEIASGTKSAILVIDDLADRAYQAEILIDPNKSDSEVVDPYLDSQLVPKSCTTLLGPPYALLDPLYAKFQPSLPCRSKPARCLIFFGGGDSDKFTAIALNALCHPKLQHLAVDVVIGSASTNLDDIKNLVRQRSNTFLHTGLRTLAGLIARADIALGAAGTASWERACLGLPSIVIPMADNQDQNANALEAAGVAIKLNLRSSVDPVNTLQKTVISIVDDPSTMYLMSHACAHLGDGRGVNRAVLAMLGPAPGLCLRPADAFDSWLYLWWANDTHVRSQSFNIKSIERSQHREWFDIRISSPLALLRVLEDGEGLPIGQIRFERSDVNENLTEVSFSLDRLARGQGLASKLLTLGLAELARCWGPSCQVYGNVQPSNTASCRAFQRAGFNETQSFRKGVRCFTKGAGSESLGFVYCD